MTMTSRSAGIPSRHPFQVFSPKPLRADELHWELIISVSSHADAILTRGVIICKIPETGIFGAYLDRMPAAPMSDQHLSLLEKLLLVNQSR